METEKNETFFSPSENYMNMYSLTLTNVMEHSNEHVKCKNHAQRKVTLPSVVGQPHILHIFA